MEFRAITSEERLGAAGVVSATLEPLPGHSDEEVVSRLEGLGASSVSVLAPGFISARAESETLAAIKEIAEVHLRPSKQLRIG